MRLSDACKMFNVYRWVVETTGSDRCRSSKGRERLFSIVLFIIPDAVIMESNFLTHLSHKYPILDSSGTVGGIRISTGSLSPEIHIIVYCHKVPLTRHNYACNFFSHYSSPCVSYHCFFITCAVKLLRGPSKAPVWWKGRGAPPATCSHFYLPYLSSLPLLASSLLPLPSSPRVWFCLYYE